MCPVCMTTTAVLIAGTTSGAGVLGLVALRSKWLRRFRDRIAHTSIRSNV